MRSRSNGRSNPLGSSLTGPLDDMSLISNSTSGLNRQESLLSTQKPSTSVNYRLSSKSPGRSMKGGLKVIPQAIPKPGRVKVGIRCRPAFQDEIDFAPGEFFSIVDCISGNEVDRNDGSRDLTSASSSNNTNTTTNTYDRVSLTLLSGKQREFAFDFAFDPLTTQDEVYDRIARPVVEDVLQGYNGTIFCYGQTGTGKTYTMGILEFVSDEHAGIIPRAIAQIFNYIYAHSEVDTTVSMSFLQIYRETIQDLLGPVTGNTSIYMEDNLAIREDPQRGFYVEGLQEFMISNYSEAEALLNMGLENRAMAPTLMNTTSSRSHTILTLNIEQRGVSSNDKAIYGTKYSRTVRSKLLMVDLAGSERVRRTVSKGARLSEAKSINTSLSALGNVIAALAEHNVTHIPYRDSKLTRLLQDSLGGTASTALIATVGPAPVNYGETLSTLLFASRCMAVKTTPIQHEEVDYAEMCARLQERVGNMEGEMATRLLEQQERYEAIMQSMQNEISNIRAEHEAEFVSTVASTSLPSSLSSVDLSIILSTLSNAFQNQGHGSSFAVWIESLIAKDDKKLLREVITNLSGLLSYCHEIITALEIDSQTLLKTNVQLEEQRKKVIENKIRDDVDMERIRELEVRAMEEEDRFLRDPNNFFSSDKVMIGSHLAPLSYFDARSRVQARHPSNNDPRLLSMIGKSTNNPYGPDVSHGIVSSGSSPATVLTVNPTIHSIASKESIKKVSLNELTSWDGIAESLVERHESIRHNLGLLLAIIRSKDKIYDTIKDELIEQLVERRKREEEVVNWSYILKYLLDSSSKLKKQMQDQKHKNMMVSPSFKSSNSNSNSNHLDRNSITISRPVTKQSSNPFDSDGNGNSDDNVNDNDSLDEKKSTIHDPALNKDNIRKPSKGITRDDGKNRYQNNERYDSSYDIPPPPPPPPSAATVMIDPMPILPKPQSNDSLFRSQHIPFSNGKLNTQTSKQPLRKFGGQSNDEQFHSMNGQINTQSNSIPDASYPSPKNRILNGNSNSNNNSNNNSNTMTRTSRVNDTPAPVISNNRGRYAMATPMPEDDPSGGEDEDYYTDNNSAVGSDVAFPSNLSFHSAATIQSIPLKVKKPPSLLAQSIVQDLGVEGPSAVAAMQVIDRVSQMTPEQLDQLDPVTRAQILQIRKDLGIDAKLKENEQSRYRSDSNGSTSRKDYRILSTETPNMNNSNSNNLSSESDRARLMMEAKRYQRNIGAPGLSTENRNSNRSNSASKPKRPPGVNQKSTRSREMFRGEEDGFDDMEREYYDQNDYDPRIKRSSRQQTTSRR